LPPEPVTIPLSDWADARLADIRRSLPSPGLETLSGPDLLAMRARFNRFAVPGAVSAGGGCRFHETGDGWIALNLSRPEDRELLPALVGSAMLDLASPSSLAAHLRQSTARALVDQGRSLGLAIAALGERPASPAITLATAGQGVAAHRAPPLVVDLSALWAGPLAGQLLLRGGARVIRVESRSRPDRMREGEPGLFGFLDSGKEWMSVDLHSASDRAAVIALIRRANVVIESARPRALLQLGIDAEQLVRDTPGLAWITITAHGISGEAAGWTGFGDDTAVAGGLSHALYDATGTIGFVGDAIADPLTGIVAAAEAGRMMVQGRGGRIILSMSGIAALALEQSRAHDETGLVRQLESWAAAVGKPIS
jgi:hypothetical protein